MATQDYPLDFFLTPMKPCKLDLKRNRHHQEKLEAAFNSNNYVAEEKIDGCHYLSIGGRMFSPRISVVTGIPVEKTLQLWHLHQVLAELGPNLILDGEVNFPGGKSQDVIQITGSDPDVAAIKVRDLGYPRYTVFDIIRDPKGNWVHNLPFIDRRILLQEIWEQFNLTSLSPHLHLNPIVTCNKKRFLDEILDKGGEGIVLKHLRQPYLLSKDPKRPKRPMWNQIKVKVEQEDDVVIMGFEPPKMKYTGKNLDGWPYWAMHETEGLIPVTRYFAHGWVGSVVFGKYNNHGELIRLGTCSGFDDSLRWAFTENPEAYIGRVITVRLMEYTADGAYRHCSFLRLHDDKNASECRLAT